MDKQPVGQLPDLTQSNNDDEIMVITNSEYNQLKKEKISDFITDLTSTDGNNAIVKGTDGKLFTKDFGNASNITEGTLPTSVLPDIPKSKLPDIETADLPLSGVTADTYAYPSSVTVNAQGQVTAIEEGSPSGANANTDLSNITDAGKEVIKENSGGSGLEVCDIGMALYIDETKGLRRYLNGQIVDINTNTQAFLNRLKQITTLHPSLLCTEEEWQTAKTMSVFGQVGKFVFNYSGNVIVSVRLPRVVNVQGLFDLQNLGMTVAESLPQHTHYIGDRLPSITSAGGNPKADVNGNDGYQCVRISNTQGASSPVYQDGAPVQQEAIQYPYFIQIATGVETENNIINEIELNNPYSLFDSKYSDHELNNLSWLKSEGQWNAKAVYPTAYDKLLKVYNGTETVEGLSVKLSTEEYTDYDFVLNTAEETFRLPLLNGDESLPDNSSDKITTQIFNSSHPYTATERVFVTGNFYSSGATASEAFINGVRIASEASGYGSFQVILNKGDVLTTTAVATDNWAKINIAPVVGNGTLYYYVGETVQNANLINAGRIGEQLANKVDTSNTQWATNACMPDYSAGISVTYPLSSNPYTAPCNGMLCPWGKPSDTRIKTIINGVTQEYLVLAELASGSGGYQGRSIYLSKGDVVYFDTSYSALAGCTFYPLKGAK